MARRSASLLVFGLLVSIGVRAGAATEPPKIAKPRSAMALPMNVQPLPPATIDNTLAVGGDEVKGKEVDTRLTVDVRVNGRGPYHFIVDSGADTSAVGLRIARDLELPLGTPSILDGTVSRDIVDCVKVDKLTLGPSTINDLELPALRETDMGGEGMIGIDALVHQRLMMDFERGLIKVEDAAKPIKPSPGDIVITARRHRGQLILTTVTTSGLPVDAVIDTGSEVTIGNSALREKLLRDDPRQFKTATAIGVTGVATPIQIANIPELRLGPVVLHNVPVAFADLMPFKLFGLSEEPALLLGTDILNNFRRVSLDFLARKVRFQLRSCDAQSVITNTGFGISVTSMVPVNRDPTMCSRA